MLFRSLHAAPHGYFCQNEADEMPQSKLRALEIPKAGGALENAHGEEQNQEAVANAYHGGVYAGDSGPNIAAFEALRRLRQ